MKNAVNVHLKSAKALAKQSPFFFNLNSKYGLPAHMSRPPGFATLLLIILEQQVSLASAKAVFDKLTQAKVKLTPKTFLRWTDEELLGFGYSRQKRRYSRLLAEAIVNKDFVFEKIGKMPDAEAREYMMRLKGIGPWTADVYLMMSDGRQDFFPAGDLALQISYKEQMKIEEKPSSRELDLIAEDWKPYRTVAAKWLWHAYLTERGSTGTSVLG